MSRREEFREKEKLRKEQEIKSFMDKVDKLYNNVDGITIPSIGIMKESEDCYINYHITKHPNSYTYSLQFYKKEYPFSMYYSKDYSSVLNEKVPEKYIDQFKELEQYFNITDQL